MTTDILNARLTVSAMEAMVAQQRAQLVMNEMLLAAAKQQLAAMEQAATDPKAKAEYVTPTQTKQVDVPEPRDLKADVVHKSIRGVQTWSEVVSHNRQYSRSEVEAILGRLVLRGDVEVVERQRAGLRPIRWIRVVGE